jgi:DNA-binding NtrC family response regulator
MYNFGKNFGKNDGYDDRWKRPQYDVNKLKLMLHLYDIVNGVKSKSYLKDTYYKKQKRILVIEEDLLFLNYIVQNLSNYERYNVYFEESYEAAKEKFESRKALDPKFDLIIIGCYKKSEDEIEELWNKAKAYYPKVPVLFAYLTQKDVKKSNIRMEPIDATISLAKLCRGGAPYYIDRIFARCERMKSQEKNKKENKDENKTDKTQQNDNRYNKDNDDTHKEGGNE